MRMYVSPRKSETSGGSAGGDGGGHYSQKSAQHPNPKKGTLGTGSCDIICSGGGDAVQICSD